MLFDNGSSMPPLSAAEVKAKLASWDALPAKSVTYERPSQVIAAAVDRIQMFLDDGYSWLEITALLNQTFGISLSPKTVETYWYRAKRRKTQPKRRRYHYRSDPSTPKNPSPTSHPPRTSATIAPLTQPVEPPAASDTPAVAADSQPEWTEADLEAALAIPDRFDEQAIARFRQALRILRSQDIPRYQRLYAEAMQSGISVAGGPLPDMQAQSKLFNHY